MGEPSKYRVSSWIKTDEQVNGSYPIVFGIEARISPRKWAHLADDAYPRFYRRAEEAQAEVDRLNSALITSLSQNGDDAP